MSGRDGIEFDAVLPDLIGGPVQCGDQLRAAEFAGHDLGQFRKGRLEIVGMRPSAAGPKKLHACGSMHDPQRRHFCLLLSIGHVTHL